MSAKQGRGSKTKGADAEREFAALLEKKTGISVQRNLEQNRSGGHDLVGTSVPWLCLEIKRQEILDVTTWWMQAVSQAKRVEGGIPVLAYRQNRKPWMIMLLLQGPISEHLAVITFQEFCVWLIDSMKVRA